MDYKKVIPNQDTRIKILGLLDFIPDEIMVRLQYRIKTGRKLDLKNPQRYSEKIQWYKLNYKNPLMKKCADKYEVREYIRKKGHEDIFNDLYGVYNNAEEIDFNVLPESFIIKLTSGSGGNIIVTNKEEENLEEIRNQLITWQNERGGKLAGEWAYNEDSKIIIEKLLDMDENNDLPDYKFFCFNGKVEYLYVMVDYVHNKDQGKCSFFDAEFNKLSYRRSEFPPINRHIEKPKNFERMKEIAEELSKDFPHVRVDFFNVNGEIIFGELTFYNASGYTGFTPDEFDYKLGEKFTINNNVY